MAAINLKAWTNQETGRSSAAGMAVMDQLLGWSFLLLCGLAFFLVAFPSYGELKIGGSPNLAPSRLLRLLMLGLMGLILMIKPFRLSLTRQNDPWAKATYYLVIAFWIWTLPLVLFNAMSFGYTVSKLKNEIIPVWISFWLTVALVKKSSQVDWVVRVLWLAMVSVLAVLAIEVVLKRNIFDGLLQVENFSTSMAFLDQSRDGFYRAKATFQHPLNLAHFLVSFGLLFLSKGLFHARPFREGVAWWSLGCVALACVYFTNTRSGLAVGALFLGILLSLRYVVWLRGFRSRLMATVMGVQLLWVPIILAGLLFLMGDLVAGQTAEQRSSTVSRTIALVNGLDGVAQSPVIGHGLGVGVTKGGVSWGGGYQYTIDNLFLLQALDHGLPAAVLLLGCFGVAAWRLMPRWHELKSGDDVGLRVGMVMVFTTSIAMYSVYALTDLFELCFVLIGATLCLQGRATRGSAHARERQ